MAEAVTVSLLPTVTATDRTQDTVDLLIYTRANDLAR